MVHVRNYRLLDGCHNCANMRDISDYGTGNLFVCLLQHPELREVSSREAENTRQFVDEYATCDEWKKASENGEVK